MFTDWNHNNRIDPVDIGIHIATSGAGIMDTVEIGGYTFSFVQELIPEKTLWGQIKTFDPKQRYAKKGSKPLNKYGNGLFCRFSLNSSAYNRVCGVYALLDDDGLLYIGQTVDLQTPFSDVYADDWYVEAVRYAYVQGLFNGTSNTTFSPNTTMTRVQITQVLANRTEGYSASDYAGAAADF